MRKAQGSSPSGWRRSPRRGKWTERPGVGERDHAGALAGGEHQGGVEAGPDSVMADDRVRAGLPAEEPQAHARYPRIGLVGRLEHAGQRRRPEHPAVLVGAAAQQGRGVAGHVAGGGVDRAAAGRHDLAVGDRPEPAGAQQVAGGQAGAHQPGPGEVGVVHAERPEHALAEVAAERDTADILDDLAERGEAVVGVGPLSARLDIDVQAAPVVSGERGNRAPGPCPPAQRRPEQVGGLAHRPDSGGVGQQVPQRGRAEARPGRYQPVGGQVVTRGGVEVDQPLLLQLHHGDRGDGLGDRGDPEDGVLIDRRPGRDVGDAVPVEPGQGPVADHRHRQAGDRPAVEDLADPGGQVGLIDCCGLHNCSSRAS
jgi:hypothetical protein